LLVFAGVALEMINESGKKHAETKELPVKKESDNVELTEKTTVRKEEETDKLKWVNIHISICWSVSWVLKLFVYFYLRIYQ